MISGALLDDVEDLDEGAGRFSDVVLDVAYSPQSMKIFPDRVRVKKSLARNQMMVM